MSKRRNHTSWEQMRWIITQGKYYIAFELVHIRKTGQNGYGANLHETYTVLTANNLAVKVIGRVTLLVQLQPGLPEVEQEFVISADEGIECLLGIDFPKTNKCVLNLHEEKL